ncbi:MAG TPA: class I SAM-dependent methyltransferase [Candidatus Omnitrophota bacterium]|nr:class I SAM-dependent methyltransferase [Candidatus Omnitrophota bacterium]
MIKVLQDWNEIGKAYLYLASKQLSLHLDWPKNWDFFLLHQMIENLPRESRIIDLGCGKGETLKFLHSMGFRNITGVDLKIPFRLRLSALKRGCAQGAIGVPFKLRQENCEKLSFPSNYFDSAICVSVIEHVENFFALLAEAFRIIVPGGTFFLTTDYWEDVCAERCDLTLFGRKWRIFNRIELGALVQSACKMGFELVEQVEIPSCKEGCLYYKPGTYYTFAALIFKKRNDL